MKTYEPTQLLSELETQTEALLNIAVRQFQMLTTDVVKQQPVPGSWSVMQCLGHLNAYGKYYLPAIEKAIDTARLKKQTVIKIFTPGWLGGYFTKLMLPSDKGTPTKKMKAPKSYTIANEGNSDAVIAEFIEQQEKLLVLLHQAKFININKVRIAISIAPFIKLKLGDVFGFLIAHNIRHIKQAERAIAAADKSSIQQLQAARI